MAEKEARPKRADVTIERPLCGSTSTCPQARLVPPGELAGAGLARWPFEVVCSPRGLLWATWCPRCGVGAIGLIPPAPPFETPFLATGCTGLGCPPAAIREAARAVLRGEPVPVDAGDAERLARWLARRAPVLLVRQPAGDLRRWAWWARRTLEELDLPPHLVELALTGLAARHGLGIPEETAHATA